MRRMVLVGVLLSTAAAWAQDRPAPAAPPAAARAGTDRLQTIMGKIAAELNLDAAQKQKLDEIVDSYLKELGDRRRKWFEMRQAEKQGDAAKAEALRAELQDAGPTNPQSTVPAILGELEPHLRADQKQQLGEIEARFTRRAAGSSELTALANVAAELNLNDRQQQQYDALVAEYREHTASDASRMIEVAGIYKELEEARRSGDEARAAELQKRMAAAQPDRRGELEKLLDRIEQILDTDQRRAFAEQRDDIVSSLTARGGGPDIRTLLRTAKRLKLEDDQKHKLADVERESEEALRALKAHDRDGRLRLAAKVKTDIMAILTPEQQRDFERQLDRRAGRRPDAPAGGEKPAGGKRGRKQAPPPQPEGSEP